MDLKQAIYSRRSIRRYKDKRIEPYIIKKILDAGLQAPSYCNTQKWRVLFLSEIEIKRIVSYGGADFLENAPLVMMVIYPKSNNRYKDDIQSAAAFIQNMLLMATSLGIGSCWVCHLPPKVFLKHYLDIPRNYEIVAAVSFGYPLHKPKPVNRKTQVADIISIDIQKMTIRDFANAVYLAQPIRPKFVEERFTKRFEN